MVYNEKLEVLKNDVAEMCKSVDTFGSKEILDLLINNSHRDEAIHQLLVRLPADIAMGELLGTPPVYRINKRTLKRLE